MTGSSCHDPNLLTADIKMLVDSHRQSEYIFWVTFLALGALLLLEILTLKRMKPNEQEEEEGQQEPRRETFEYSTIIEED